METILLQERRRRELPSPLPPCPKRRELLEDIHLAEPDPGIYDRFCHHQEEEDLRLLLLDELGYLPIDKRGADLMF